MVSFDARVIASDGEEDFLDICVLDSLTKLSTMFLNPEILDIIYLCFLRLSTFLNQMMTNSW